MSILWYLPLVVIFVFIIFYNYLSKRSVSRPAEMLRLFIASLIALATLGLFIWVVLAQFDSSIRTVTAAALGASVAFLLKDPGANLRQF